MSSTPSSQNTSSTLSVALIQHPPVFFNTQESILLLDNLILDARQSHSNLGIVVVPESWLGGYPVWLDLAPNAATWNHAGAKELYQLLTHQALTTTDHYFNQLKQLANQYDVYLVIGFHEKLGHTLYNTQALFAPDGRYKLHRKLTPTYSEKLIWGVGDGSTLSVLPSRYGNIGGLICWEHWMPLARAAMHAQHEAIHIAQWPYVKDIHQVASRHYAFEGRCFVLASGGFARCKDLIDGFDLHPFTQKKSPGRALLLSMIENGDDDIVLQGGSCVIHPDGHVIKAMDYHQSTTLISTIDLHDATAEYMTLDTNGHYARPDIFTLEVNTRKQINVQFKS